MEIHVEFDFRGIQHSCTAVIDSSAYPCFIFTTLNDAGLINEFGEITIATDGKKRLVRKGDYSALDELSDAILSAMKEAPEFRTVSMKMKILQHARNAAIDHLN